MKIKIFFGGVLCAAALLLLAGCDPNPFVAPSKPTSAPTQNIETNTAAGTSEVINDIQTEQVKLPDETQVLAATQTTEQTVTFDSKDSSTAKLAKCLTQKGVRMYGAYWCPHCADQKAMFGDDFHFVKYFECDPKGPDSQTARCTKDKIDGYPTWYFPKSGFDPGVKELDKIATLSGCEDALK